MVYVARGGTPDPAGRPNRLGATTGGIGGQGEASGGGRLHGWLPEPSATHLGQISHLHPPRQSRVCILAQSGHSGSECPVRLQGAQIMTIVDEG